ncbi:hypothetical protein BDF20DRAFT_833389 [Mycotypha africana]|uniref:uncharacterized protein n=1 Tax=Mycotypha africana TaxID=64632 RepID=UPI002301685B|nr:uncharacterized protein BDF20DRAFT_833389 [Mycotypha africana]KAI8988544.1 hypothetical protein BDF20DRAFT_833389 [Mycotypha africana]
MFSIEAETNVAFTDTCCGKTYLFVSANVVLKLLGNHLVRASIFCRGFVESLRILAMHTAVSWLYASLMKGSIIICCEVLQVISKKLDSYKNYHRQKANHLFMFRWSTIPFEKLAMKPISEDVEWSGTKVLTFPNIVTAMINSINKAW